MINAEIMYEHLFGMYLRQLRHNEAELMITEKLQEGQSLVAAMHQLLDALQRHFLIHLSLGWKQNRERYINKDISNERET